MLYEFPTQYVFDPEDTSITGSGSGVHLFEDVTLTFDIIDRDGSIIDNSVSINKNPFIGSMQINILNSSGSSIYPNYYSGASLRSFSLTKQENIDIFGSYTKDFGLLVDLVDNTAGNFDSVFQLRGNLPLIKKINITDGSGEFTKTSDNPFGIVQLTFDPLDQPYQLNVWNYFLNKVAVNSLPFTNYGGWDDDLVTDIYDIDPYLYLISGGGSDYNSPFTGKSIFTLDLAQAWLDGQITGSALVESFADWFIGTGTTGFTGVAKLEVDYIDFGGRESEEYFIYPSSGYWPQTNVTNLEIEAMSTSFSGTGAPIIGVIEIEVEFENDPLYINFTHFDIYADTNSGVEPSFENFNKRVPIFNQSKDINFQILAEDIEYNVAYYFRVIPYSSLGSGQHFIIGPHIITSPPKIPSILEANLLHIREGSETGVVDLITGQINSTGNTVVDTIPVNTFRSINYITKIKDSTNQISSSRLSVVITGSGIGESSIFEYAASPNSNIVYNTSGDLGNIYLLAQTNFSPATYKFYKTSI
jgi:hypothetical protein